jgi:hypothetical protein
MAGEPAGEPIRHARRCRRDGFDKRGRDDAMNGTRGGGSARGRWHSLGVAVVLNWSMGAGQTSGAIRRHCPRLRPARGFRGLGAATGRAGPLRPLRALAEWERLSARPRAFRRLCPRGTVREACRRGPEPPRGQAVRFTARRRTCGDVQHARPEIQEGRRRGGAYRSPTSGSLAGSVLRGARDPRRPRRTRRAWRNRRALEPQAGLRVLQSADGPQPAG